jgi:cyclohexa-1,5-dienecarbonyl-CoA hydratase
MTRQYKFIRFTQTDERAVLTLHHPPLNILTIAMIEEINQALTGVRADSPAKVLLLRGEGQCFSAGVDVSDHLPEKVERMLEVVHEMFDHLAALEIPTISAVHGAVLGGGLELAVFTDMTFAAAGAKLGQPEIKLGVFPPLAAAYFPELIGLKHAYELVLTGRTISADEARQRGLINAVFAEEEFTARVDEIARTLAQYSRPILVAAKRAIRQAAGRSFDEALATTERIYLDEVMATEDALEGLTAFLHKRPPRWKNH